MTDSASTRARYGSTTVKLHEAVLARTGTSPLASVAALASAVPISAAAPPDIDRDAINDAVNALQFAAVDAAKAMELGFWRKNPDLAERAAELRKNALRKARRAVALLEQVS